MKKCTKIGLFLLISGILLLQISAMPAPAQEISNTPNESAFVTNGGVSAMVTDGTTTYIGGTFSQVGPFVGCGVPIDETSGYPLAAYPKVVNGQINAVVPDGSGGWYIGGTFTQIGDTVRNRIAHINSDGALDAFWDPDSNGTVYALAVSGDTVYAGGSFTNIGGQGRNYIAALDTSTGNATSWNPNANNGVSALAASGNTVYAGGNFTGIGGQSRNFIAALDALTGNATSWNPNANDWVSALALSGNTVYAGGIFTSIGMQSRNYIAALDASTGNATSWNANIIINQEDEAVSALAVSGNTVYAGGVFNTIGEQSRNSIAALDASTGNATSWNANVNGNVYALAVSGNTVYVGGNFTSIGVQSLNNIAALDASTGNAASWNPNANSPVYALAVSDNTVYAGGKFTSIGMQSRNLLAALDASTGILTSWNPNANNGVYAYGAGVTALAVSDDTVYVGGQFTSIGGQSRNYLAALDASTGNATSWNANIIINPGGGVVISALAASGNTVYVGGGGFNSIGGQSRNYLAALDASTGNATSWNPNPNGGPSAIVVSGNTVYVGGGFTGIGLQSRNYIAALDASTGNPTSWNPGSNGPVSALAVSGNTVFAGGTFSYIGGQSRNYIAALDASTGNATSWNANIIFDAWITDLCPGIYALAASGNTVYAGGYWTSIGGQTRNFIAALDASTGIPTSWNPNITGPFLCGYPAVSALAVSGNTIYVGGEFTGIGVEARGGFAMFGITYSISGTVKDSGGSLLGGVGMALTGAASATTQTASNGTYAFTGLLSGAYIITPTEGQDTFSPKTINATITDSDLASQDFTATYVQQTGSLTVAIKPAAAASAGGAWNVDGGAWRTSGTTISGLTVGQHTVAFNNVTGWTAPASQTITIANGQTTAAGGTYAQLIDSLRVTISSLAAVHAGAQWQVDGGVWQNSGVTVNGLTVGRHVVGFKEIQGWKAPADHTVTIAKGQITTSIGAYLQLPVVLKYNIANGAASSITRQVTLNNQTSGDPSMYMASESQDFTGVVWQAYSAAPKFTLSAGSGTKTVYFKVKNSAGESVAASDAIQLIVPPTVTSFEINNGATATSGRTVTLDNTATESPTYYTASQSSTFIGATWKPYAAAPAFTLSSGNGTKIVYFKVKNAAGVSKVVSETITLAIPAARAGD